MPEETSHDELRVFIIAGEASGDQLGSAVLSNIQQQSTRPLVIKGIGGSEMERHGVKSIFPMRELSVMGLVEIFPKIPKLLKRISETAQAIIDFDPDIIVTIDAPDFCFRVVKRVRKKTQMRTKFIHYVAPTVWAWRPKRAKKLAKLYDTVLCLFPFEPKYFEKEGMQAFYVGHPAVEEGWDSITKKQARDDLGVDDAAEVLCVLFGSRHGEVKRHGDIFAQTAQSWLNRNDNRQVIIQTLPHLKSSIQALCNEFKEKVLICDTTETKKQVFAASDIALAVSGTVGLELGLARLPHIIAYRANAFSFWLFKKLATIRFAHLMNIIKDREIVPEFIQEKCTADQLLNGLEVLDRDVQRQEFSSVCEMLKLPNNQLPGSVASKFILDK